MMSSTKQNNIPQVQQTTTKPSVKDMAQQAMVDMKSEIDLIRSHRSNINRLIQTAKSDKPVFLFQSSLALEKLLRETRVCLNEWITSAKYGYEEEIVEAIREPQRVEMTQEELNEKFRQACIEVQEELNEEVLRETEYREAERQVCLYPECDGNPCMENDLEEIAYVEINHPDHFSSVTNMFNFMTVMEKANISETPYLSYFVNEINNAYSLVQACAQGCCVFGHPPNV